MVKGGKKSAVAVATAPALKHLMGGKRDAEKPIEKAVNLKKQKVEQVVVPKKKEKVNKKAKKAPPPKEVESKDEDEEPVVEEPDSKGESEEEMENLAKAANGTEKDESDEEDSGDDDEEDEGDSDEEESEGESEDEELETPKKVQTPANNQSEKTGSKTLFLGNLSYDITEDDVIEFFNAGEEISVRLSNDADGRFKGYGHVEFTTEEAAKKALQLANKELMGRQLKLDYAREKGANGAKASQTIFIKGFDTSLEINQIESNLKQHFGSCGEITRVSLPMDYETKQSKGIAYMDFGSVQSVKKALELNGSEFGGSSITVDEAKPRVDVRETGWSASSRGGGRSGGGRGGGGRFGGGGRGGRGGRDGGGRGGGFGGRRGGGGRGRGGRR